MSSNHFVIGLLVCGLLSSSFGHNYFSFPVSRGDQRDTQTGCRVGGEGGINCPGPCDRTVSQITRAPIVVARGQSLTMNWYRHTHPGGFIRFAWSPTSQSDSHASFDSQVDQYMCKEVGGCGPSDPSQPFYSTNGLDCAATITVPSHLADGAWTLQWAYFGGWYNAGDYYACVDYQVSGGTALSSTVPAATFQGGDYTYPNENVCLFYGTDQLHICTVEPCTNGTYPTGIAQKGPVHGFGQGSVPPPTPTPSPTPTPTVPVTPPPPVTTAKPQPITTQAPIPPAPVTTAKPQPVTTAKVQPITTATPQPVTTARVQPMTTAMPQPVTTAKVLPMTTAKVLSMTTAMALPVTTSMAQTPNSPTSTTGSVFVEPSNCAGLSVRAASYAIITEMDFWGAGYHMVITIHVAENILSDWYLEFTYPPSQTNGGLIGAYNSGSLKCQTTHSAVIQANSWAKSTHSGGTLLVEVTGNNPGSLTADAIRENTVVTVYLR